MSVAPHRIGLSAAEREKLRNQGLIALEGDTPPDHPIQLVTRKKTKIDRVREMCEAEIKWLRDAKAKIPSTVITERFDTALYVYEKVLRLVNQPDQ